MDPIEITDMDLAGLGERFAEAAEAATDGAYVTTPVTREGTVIAYIVPTGYVDRD
jgi:hypothetical protein